MWVSCCALRFVFTLPPVVICPHWATGNLSNFRSIINCYRSNSLKRLHFAKQNSVLTCICIGPSSKTEVGLKILTYSIHWFNLLILSVDSAVCMERLVRHNEEKLLFKGNNIHCRNEPLFKGWGNSLVYRGHFKNKENDPVEKIAVRQIKVTDCCEQ